LTLILIVIAILFAQFFCTMDADSGMQKRTELIIFTILVGFWVVFPIIFRTPASSLAAFVGFGAQLFLALRRSGFPLRKTK